MKKAFLIIPHWSDFQDVDECKSGTDPVYSKSAGKAKYNFMLSAEDDSVDWFKYRALRWPEMDLLPAKVDPIIHELSESSVRKMIHTCAANRKNSDRNYYNGSIDDQDFNFLIKKGLAERNKNHDKRLSTGTTYFHLTESGLKAARSTQEIERKNL